MYIRTNMYVHEAPFFMYIRTNTYVHEASFLVPHVHTYVYLQIKEYKLVHIYIHEIGELFIETRGVTHTYI